MAEQQTPVEQIDLSDVIKAAEGAENANKLAKKALQQFSAQLAQTQAGNAALAELQKENAALKAQVEAMNKAPEPAHPQPEASTAA